MSLKPGKKYLIKTTKQKIVKKDHNNFGAVDTTAQNGKTYYYPKIDYVQNANKDDEYPAYPVSQFHAESDFSSAREPAVQLSLLNYSHDDIPFFGANRVVYDNLKYEDIYEGIENDELYQISSSAQIKYDGVAYNHGSIFYVPNGGVTSFEVVKGNVLLLEVEFDIAATTPQVQSDFYFVYGTDSDAYTHGIQYGGTAYYPGDMFQAGASNSYKVWNGSSHETFAPETTFIPPAVVMALVIINNPSDKTQWGINFQDAMDPASTTLTQKRHYLVYGHTNAFYNGHSLRPEVLLKNIFKTGSDISFGWDAKTTDRKFPLIREIVKSDSIERGVNYYIASDRQLNASIESSIKYDSSELTTSTGGAEFSGKKNVSSYSVPEKAPDITDDSKDTEILDLNNFGTDTERYSGNPFVIRKETIGLRKGQDYIIVPEKVSGDLVVDTVYFVKGTGAITNGGVTFENEEVFKATAINFGVIGQADVFELINTITLTGYPTDTQVSIDGASPVDYSSTILSTSYDKRSLRFKITTCSYPLLYWSTSVGSFARVYPIVTKIKSNSSVHVQGYGDGSVVYPSKNLYYLCEGIGLKVDKFGKVTKKQIDDSNHKKSLGEDGDEDIEACTDEDGAWVPQLTEHESVTRRYYDGNYFEATGGQCKNPLYDRDEAACRGNGLDWTYDTGADVFHDSLFVYNTDKNYSLSVTTSASAVVGANLLSVVALVSDLAIDDCIVFDGAVFVLSASASSGGTSISGRLLGGEIGSGATGLIGIKPDTHNPVCTGCDNPPCPDNETDCEDDNGTWTANPYEKYYVENLEITYDPATPSEEGITVSALPVDVAAGMLLKFKNSGVCVAEFKVSVKADKGATELEGSLRLLDFICTGCDNSPCPDNETDCEADNGTWGPSLSLGDKAELPPSKVGTLAINKQYNNEQRFYGVPNFNTIRAYNYKPLSNQSAHVNSYENIAIYEVCTAEETLTNGEKFKVGGNGYIKYNGETYHAEAKGRVTINHEKNISGDLDGADTLDVRAKGAVYTPLGVQVMGTRSLPSHIPAGTELVFPVGVFKLSKNADEGDVSITGEILADYMENVLPSSIWHNDESYYYKIDRSEIIGVGGTYSRVDKDGKVIPTKGTFVYKTQEPEGLVNFANGPYDDMRLEWENGEKVDAITQRKVINITGSEKKEYYTRIKPVEATSGSLIENKTYQVKADGSAVEINNVLSNGELVKGVAYAVGGHVYEKEEDRKFENSTPPERAGKVPELIVYNNKAYIPGEVFEAVKGETHWAEVTINGNPQLLPNNPNKTKIYRVPVAGLSAPIPVVPKLRTEDDVIWSPPTDLEGNELIPLFGRWDEEKKEWVDEDWFDEGNLTSEGRKIHESPLKLKFGNGAVGEVLDVDPGWEFGTEKYNSADDFYEKGCTAIFLRLVSGEFENGQVGKTGSGSANSGILYGGYAAGTIPEMKVKALPHALSVGTELVFYPSHPYPQFRAEPEEERFHESRQVYGDDYWSDSREARRFILSSEASAGDTTIEGTLLASYSPNVQTFAGVGFKARAEIFREIVYNDKVYMAGERFSCKRDVKTLDHGESTLIKSWSDSGNSTLGILNSTKMEKVISYDDSVDYMGTNEIFSGISFSFEHKSTSVSRNNTSPRETGLFLGDVTGSQSRFGEVSDDYYFFLPPFGLINTDTALSIHKVEKLYEATYSNILNNTEVTSYTSSDGNFKVGGQGDGYITYASNTKNIGESFSDAADEVVTFHPSKPVTYQKINTGLEVNKFYLVGAEDLLDTTTELGTDDSPETLYQKLVYNSKRYFPFLRDRLPQFADVNYNIAQSIDGFDGSGEPYLQLHAPYVQSYIFGRAFSPFLENRLRDGALGRIKILKLSDSGFTEDATVINTGRFFSLINSMFMYYTILINKKFNGQWGGWEISEANVTAGPEKVTGPIDTTPSKIRIFGGADLSTDIETVQYKIATSSESYYTANYPQLVNVVEEKQPVLVNGMEDERLYFVESGNVVYAKYTVQGDTTHGFSPDNDCPTDISGVYQEEKFFYGKTDAWVSNGDEKLRTVGPRGSYYSDIQHGIHADIAVDRFGNFDEYFIKPANTDDQFLVSTCYDPWEIQASRVYNVRGHDNDKIEYNGRVYGNGDLITGKSLNSPNTLASDPLARTLMPVEEYKLRQAASPQPWMFSNEGVYSKELGYKRLTPLLYKDHGSSATLEANKRYILHNSSTVTEGSYNAMDQMIPSNEFIGAGTPTYSIGGTATVRQKFEDGQTLLPGVEYFVYGQGQVTYPDSIVTSSTANVGGSVTVSVASVPSSIQVGQTFEFDNGAELIVASSDIGEITGEVRNVAIESGASAAVIINVFSSDVVKVKDSELGVGEGNLSINPLPQDLFQGEVLAFSGGGIFILSENAYAGDTVIKGDVISAHIASDEEAKIVDYKELKTKTITASGNFSTSGASNTFKGLKGFSRVGGKLGSVEILTAAASGSIKKNFLYKVFGSGYATYKTVNYYGENIVYGTGATFTTDNNNSPRSTIREVIDPYDVKAGDVIYAYGAPTVNLFEYLDASESIQYITENNGASTTWSADYSNLKVHKVPYTSNDFDSNQATIASGRVYGIEPGVTYTIKSNDKLTNGDERRAVVKYVKDIGSCKQKDGTLINSSKYHNKFDCTRRDILVVDFGGPDYTEASAINQYSDSDKVEHGDYKTAGVKFRVTADFPAHYTNNIILKTNDVLEFSKGGKFVLSEDIDLDDLDPVEEEGETRYYGTMKGIIPFGHSLYHLESCPVLDWEDNFKEFYYTSDRTVVAQNTTNGVPERIYVGQGEIEVTSGNVYRVEAGVEIVYNDVIKTIGEEFDGVSKDGSVVDSWVPSTRSNGLEYVTRVNKTDTEFVGVAGRPFVEIIEGNPKIFVKDEGPIEDGSYIVEGDSIAYGEDYMPDTDVGPGLPNGEFAKSYYNDYCDTIPTLSPNSTRFLTGSYAAGVITAGDEDSFMIGSFDSDAPYKNSSWLYDSTKINGLTIGGTENDLQIRKGNNEYFHQYSSPFGIAEAQDYVDSESDDDTFEIDDNNVNSFLVTEGFLNFDLNKGSESFPEVNENQLTYGDTGESVLFDLSYSDGFEEFKQNGSYLTAAVFGAGDFALHRFNTSMSTLHETTHYKAFGNLNASEGAIEGKVVTSIEEDYMHKVKAGTIKYRDKLLVIDNELGYCSVDSSGNQVVFHNQAYTDANGGAMDNQYILRTDAFKNDTYKGIKIKRVGKSSGTLLEPTITTNDFLVFDSEIEYTGSAEYADGDSVLLHVDSGEASSVSSKGIEVASLPVGIINGELLFFYSPTDTAVTSITNGKAYCVRSGSYRYSNREYGPYGFSRFFVATGDGSVDGEDIVEVSILKTSQDRGAGANDLYGTISQSALKKGYKCVRQVSVKIDDLGDGQDCEPLNDGADPITILHESTELYGRIADPLFFIVASKAEQAFNPSDLLNRSLTDKQILTKVITYTSGTYHGLTATYTTDTPPVPATGIENWEKVYSKYTAGQRFKGTQAAPSWRTVSGTPIIRYSNTINHVDDFFWRGGELDLYDKNMPSVFTNHTTDWLSGERLSGQLKILFVLDKTILNDDGYGITTSAAGTFPVRYHWYDLDYGNATRSTLRLGSDPTIAGNFATVKGSNNFFVGDGGSHTIVINDLLVKTVTETAIKSSVLVGKVVASGDIQAGKDYFVWGTGSIVYRGVEIQGFSGPDIDSLKDKDSPHRFSSVSSGDWSSSFDENSHTRKSWDRQTTDTIHDSLVPKNEAQFYVGRPMVFEIFPVEDGGNYTTEVGAIYYVFGEGSINYSYKEIFATNKYIAVATDTRYTSDNKLIPSGAISYGGKMIATLGDQYDAREDFSFSPIPPVGVWTYGALIQLLQRIPTLSADLNEQVYVYRKVHGREALTSGKKYYVFGKSDFISYKQGDVTRQHFPRGQGREDIVVKGDGTYNDDLTITNDTSITLDEPNNNFSDLEVGSEITVNWTYGGEVYYATRTIETHTSDTNITVDSAFPGSLASGTLHSTWQGRNPNKTSGKVTVTGTFSVGSGGISPSRFLLGRSSILKKGYSCCVRTKRKRTLDGSGNPTTGFGEIERHSRITYADIFATSSSDKKIPLGTYAVRGRGAIIYPVFKFSSAPSESDYAFVDGGPVHYCSGASGDDATACDSNGGSWVFNTSSLFKHKTYSKTFMAGDVFFAIELPAAIGESNVDGGDAPFYYKTTGQERVYRIPDDYKKVLEDNSMDQFLDMAPPKNGVSTGQLLVGQTYEVLYKNEEGDILGKSSVENLSNGEDILAGKNGEHVKYQIGANKYEYYKAGAKFEAVAIKDDGHCEGNANISSKGACLADGRVWKEGVKGGVRLVREFYAHKNLIVRPVEGIRNCAPAGGWSNEWSMFITSAHHHPSRTSTWHHDYYGDTMGFLNQRCHIFSEDFKLKMYRHLLDTFSYGIKPVIRSEAPPGHTYLEGSNAQQSWFYSTATNDQLNQWYYSSCQIYKPDYYIESVQVVDNMTKNTELGILNKVWGGVCTGCQTEENGSDCSFKNRAECEQAGGTWVEAHDLVKVRLNRRLTHTPGTAFTAKDKKVTNFGNKQLLQLWHAMGAGPFTAEVYRTDENTIVEYLIREKYDTKTYRLKNHAESKNRKVAKAAVDINVEGEESIDGHPKIRSDDKLEFETPDGKIITNEKTQLQCHKGKIGDSAPDIFIWQLPDDPFGACEPRFYFTKLVPYVHDDNRGIGTKWTKTPVTVDPFIQMEQYLRGFCGGFVDKKSDPKHEEITEVDVPTGTFDLDNQKEIFTKESLDPTCYKSKDYDYLFENLSVQSLEGVGKTLFKDYNDVTVEKTRVLVIKREFILPNPIINLNYTDVNTNSSRWNLVSQSGARGYVIERKTSEVEAGKPPQYKEVGTVPFVIVKRGSKWVFNFERKFIDEYPIKLTDLQTVPYDVEYRVTPVNKNGSKLNISPVAIYTGQADMLVVKDSHSKAVIKFTPSYCSDPSKTTKSECLKECRDCEEPPCPKSEEECEEAGGNWIDTGGRWSPVKYFLLERRRAALPHYTEWVDHDLEVDVVGQSLIQAKINKKLKESDRVPSGQFEINDINLRREIDSDSLYAGVSKEYEIKVFAYFKAQPQGKCIKDDEELEDAYGQYACALKGGTWTPNNTEIEGKRDDFETLIKVPAYFRGMKNPFEAANFLWKTKTADGKYYVSPSGATTSIEMGDAVNNQYHAWVITNNEGIYKLRFRNLIRSAAAPIDPATRKELPVLKVNGVKKLFYDIKFRVKIGYNRDNLNKSTTKRSPWEEVKTFRNAKSGKEIVYEDNENYRGENVNYRVTKVQTTNATSRWMSPLMLEDELTGYPDSRKGFGPLPNIKLSAHVFNQFANAINLLNEARLDIPITIRYRYHTKTVAKPSTIAPTDGIGVHQNMELNVPTPTWGTYTVGGNTCHPVNSAQITDRYEWLTPQLGADPSSEADFVHTDAWGDENLGLSVIYGDCRGQVKTYKSDWYTDSGHTSFCADKKYGFSQYPLVRGNIDDLSASIAHFGTQTDVEFKAAGDQTAFKYAVPSILKSRVNSDDLVLSGRMDRSELWTPRIEAVGLSYWGARWAGWPSDKWPYSCNFDDQTGSGIFADHFLWMGDNGGFWGPDDGTIKKWGSGEGSEKKEWHNRYVRFIDAYDDKSYCEDISGTFILKAPALKSGMGGIIVTHQMTGSEYKKVCTTGGSQSSLCFSTRASTGDNNMRIKIPLKDKLGPHTQCRITKPITTQTRKITKESSKEDEDTMAKSTSSAGPDSGRAKEYEVKSPAGAAVDMPETVKSVSHVFEEDGNALLPGKLIRTEGRDENGKLVFCVGNDCPAIER